MQGTPRQDEGFERAARERAQQEQSFVDAQRLYAEIAPLEGAPLRARYARRIGDLWSEIPDARRVDFAILWARAWRLVAADLDDEAELGAITGRVGALLDRSPLLQRVEIAECYASMLERCAELATTARARLGHAEEIDELRERQSFASSTALRLSAARAYATTAACAPDGAERAQIRAAFSALGGAWAGASSRDPSQIEIAYERAKSEVAFWILGEGVDERAIEDAFLAEHPDPPEALEHWLEAFTTKDLVRDIKVFVLRVLNNYRALRAMP